MVQMITNEQENINNIISMAVNWAYDGSRGALRVTARGGTWNVLCGNVANFTGVDYQQVKRLMTDMAQRLYGEHWYGVLWAMNGFPRQDGPHRDAKGVFKFLARARKSGAI